MLTPRHPRSLARLLLPWPVLLIAAMPAATLESRPSTAAQVSWLAQAPGKGEEVIPAEVQGWFDQAKTAYAKGNPAEALGLQQKVVSWVRAHLGPAHPFRARALNLLGILLSVMGSYREALAPSQEALQIYRELAKTNAVYMNDLGVALNNLGIRYSDLGQWQEALAPTMEAVQIRRELVKTNPAFRGDLAGSLINLGNRYTELGQWQEALAPTQEALQIYRELVKTNPALLNDLAAALNNLGLKYRDLGRRQEALAPTEEAVKIRRELAKTNSAFRGDLASSLDNLGIRYSELGRRQEGLAPTEEAVKLYRELAKTNPAVRGDLAGSLNNLGYRYRELGRRQEGLAPTEESLNIYRELAKTNPAFRDGLAGGLNNLGVRYSELGRRQEALAPTEEAVKLYRELAKTNPAFLGDLALALNNLGIRQLNLDEPEQARTAYEESLKIIRPLAATNPAFQEDLQRTLNNLEELNRKEGIRTGAEQVLAASDLRYLPRNDPTTPVKRAVVRLLPSFSGKRSGIGLIGTGFVVRREGDRAWIATALHVVRDPDDYGVATKVEAELFTGPLPTGLLPPRLEVVLSNDPKQAQSGDGPVVLEVRGLPPDIQPLPLATTPAQGALMVVGHPSNQGPWTVVTYPLLKTTDQALLLDGGLDSGASGSPVISASGQVVGVVYDSPQVSKSRPIAQVWAFPVKALAAKMSR